MKSEGERFTFKATERHSFGWTHPGCVRGTRITRWYRFKHWMHEILIDVLKMAVRARKAWEKRHDNRS